MASFCDPVSLSKELFNRGIEFNWMRFGGLKYLYVWQKSELLGIVHIDSDKNSAATPPIGKILSIYQQFLLDDLPEKKEKALAEMEMSKRLLGGRVKALYGILTSPKTRDLEKDEAKKELLELRGIFDYAINQEVPKAINRFRS